MSKYKLSSFDEVDEVAPVVREGLGMGISGQRMTEAMDEEMLGYTIFFLSLLVF